MIRVCAWCDKDMGNSHDNFQGITHGICDDCLSKQIIKDSMPDVVSENKIASHTFYTPIYVWVFLRQISMGFNLCSK